MKAETLFNDPQTAIQQTLLNTLKQALAVRRPGAIVQLAEIVTAKWDRFFAFGPGYSLADVNRIIGQPWCEGDGWLLDYHQLLMFTQSSQVSLALFTSPRLFMPIDPSGLSPADAEFEVLELDAVDRRTRRFGWAKHAGHAAEVVAALQMAEMTRRIPIRS